jgi:hypothetical protein
MLSLALPLSGRAFFLTFLFTKKSSMDKVNIEGNRTLLNAS